MTVENTNDKTRYGAIESILFVAGDPVTVKEIARILDRPEKELRGMLAAMERDYKVEGRGIIPLMTEDTVQFVTNIEYSAFVESLIQPEQTKSVSGSLMETLAVVAYKQPVTRADIESVRGVRCDYAVTQLLKMGLIESCGRKEVLGRPVLFRTTDLFLRKFGLHSRTELPGFDLFSEEDHSKDENDIETV